MDILRPAIYCNEGWRAYRPLVGREVLIEMPISSMTILIEMLVLSDSLLTRFGGEWDE